mgnify:CR=1 FL=1
MPWGVFEITTTGYIVYGVGLFVIGFIIFTEKDERR